ncbi:MAG: exonuclease domain-containing protein [Myxococcota bacterium]
MLLVDCQSTGASPAHGHLLELAWARGRAEEPEPIELTSRVVALPEGESIPRRIQRMTGISDDELTDAVELEQVWRELRHSAAAIGEGPDARAVIHYARFERSFLGDAHTRHEPDSDFPLDIICTHRIAQRLFPELPRRGLRALAGYLGHTVPEDKRAAHHVAATAAIWHHTVRELDIEYGVTTLGELHEWLATREPTRRGGKGYALPRETRLALPDVPGVYRMLSKSGDVLYVGKATSLKSRVNSYFQTRRGLSSKKLELVTQVWDVDVTECATPLEAAVLETDEIKRHSPAYNTALRHRDRTLNWASADWASFREQPDEEHSIGPLRDPSRLALLGQLRRGGLADIPEDDLEYLGESHEMLADGLDVLADEYGIDLRAPNAPLRRLALERWRTRYEEKLAERESEDVLDDGIEDELEEQTGGERVWTPELVAEQLERVVRWTFRSLRFARWMYVLRDSRVEWLGPDGELRALELRGGQVARTPVDAGAARTAERSMDVPTWDRLRVLTTELRRLVAAEASPRVHLRGLRSLGPDQLAHLFRWI